MFISKSLKLFAFTKSKPFSVTKFEPLSNIIADGKALPSAIIFDKGSNLVTEKGFDFVKANSFNDLEINIEKILN